MSELAIRDHRAPQVVRLDTEQLRFIANTEFIPKKLRGNLPAILATVATGREVGLGDMASLRHINIIDGTPSFSAQSMVALVRRAGHSITGHATSERAEVRGQRRDTGDVIEVSWTLDDARTAGLLGKQNWKQYPKAMLWNRAVSELCRELFSDVAAGNGWYTSEELEGEYTEDSVGEPEADAVRGGREPVSVSQPVLDGGEAASPTDTETEGGGGSPSVDLGDPDIPFGDAPPDPPKPSAAQIKKLNVLVKAVGPESLAERVPNLLSRVYATVADIRGWPAAHLINTVGGWDAEQNRLRWSPLRDSLSKHEAHELIERLERLEAK